MRRARHAGSVVTEAPERLIWEAASWLRWPLLAAAILAAVLPGPGARVATAALLLLLAPALSEVAAREHLHGTRDLVFSQPAVLRAALASPARGLAFASGLLFVAGFAAGAGSLTRGRQLFSGVYVALWYAAVSGAGPLDFCGAFGGGLAAGALPRRGRPSRSSPRPSGGQCSTNDRPPRAASRTGWAKLRMPPTASPRRPAGWGTRGEVSALPRKSGLPPLRSPHRPRARGGA